MPDVQPSSPLYLLDTNILIHYSRRDALGQAVAEQFSLLSTPSIPLISYVTEAEVRAFASRRQWGQARLEQMNFLLQSFRRVPIDAPGILEAYIAIDTFSYQAGRDMGKNDLWIAATASVTAAILLTTDRDFDHLDPRFLTRKLVAL